jgi:hypothetical protein
MMANWGWDKDKHYTWYNQRDFKTPRTYRERYGVDYKPMKSELERQRDFKQGVLLFLIVILFYGVLAWMI